MKKGREGGREKGREGKREGERERRKEGGREGRKGIQLTACLSVAISYKTQPRAQISLKIRKYKKLNTSIPSLHMYMYNVLYMQK